MAASTDYHFAENVDDWWARVANKKEAPASVSPYSNLAFVSALHTGDDEQVRVFSFFIVPHVQLEGLCWRAKVLS